MSKPQAPPAPPPTASAPSQTPATDARAGLQPITSKGSSLPLRMIVHAVEGWGKTSLGAQFPNPIFMQAKGETGLDTLIDSGQLPEIPHWPETTTWEEMQEQIKFLANEPHDYQTLVMDTFGGFERLCHEMVCRRDYSGDWGEHGFTSFHRGYGVSAKEIDPLCATLDTLREKRKMQIILLCHTVVTPFKNPDGDDYDRFEPEMHKKTWAVIRKWADIILFGNYFTNIEKESGKPKASGGFERHLYTQRRAAHDAKNRHGLPTKISCGNSPQEAYKNFKDAMKRAKKGTN